MTLRIDNVLTGKKVPFSPVEPGKVKMYVCGVTVYGRCHVGHLRCYLSFDAIIRYFMYKGYTVEYVRNFTDIDDKIIARATEIAAGPDGEWVHSDAYRDYTSDQWAQRHAEDASIRERARERDGHLAEVVADYFIEKFSREDFAPFDLVPAMREPRVSQHIGDVLDLIEKIMANGFAYTSDGDVYFDVPAYQRATCNYGRLSRRRFEDLQEGTRVKVGDRKRHPADFALWKRSMPDEPAWASPWGAGRPGWHIECSAMSHVMLGTPFDIHGGGQDLIFPHHENEIAQSEAGLKTPFCNTWMHNGFVTVDGVKMSKSLGNFITISQALDMAPPEVWRMLVLGSHYASPIDFSRTRDKNEATVRGTIDIAFDRLTYFYETLARADAVVAKEPSRMEGALLSDPRGTGLEARFVEAMDDDFNTARAMAIIGESMKYLNELCDMKRKQVKALPGGADARIGTIQSLLAQVRKVCGVLNICTRPAEEALEEMRTHCLNARGIDCAQVEEKLAARLAAREQKNWALSDEIRDELATMGVELQDGPGGTVWKVARS